MIVEEFMLLLDSKFPVDEVPGALADEKAFQEDIAKVILTGSHNAYFSAGKHPFRSLASSQPSKRRSRAPRRKSVSNELTCMFCVRRKGENCMSQKLSWPRFSTVLFGVLKDVLLNAARPQCCRSLSLSCISPAIPSSAHVNGDVRLLESAGIYMNATSMYQSMVVVGEPGRWA